MTKVTSITPRVYVDDEGVPNLATADGCQVWDIEFDDGTDPIGIVGRTAGDAEAAALAYIAA